MFLVPQLNLYLNLYMQNPCYVFRYSSPFHFMIPPQWSSFFQCHLRLCAFARIGIVVVCSFCTQLEQGLPFHWCVCAPISWAVPRCLCQKVLFELSPQYIFHFQPSDINRNRPQLLLASPHWRSVPPLADLLIGEYSAGASLPVPAGAVNNLCSGLPAGFDFQMVIRTKRTKQTQPISESHPNAQVQQNNQVLTASSNCFCAAHPDVFFSLTRWLPSVCLLLTCLIFMLTLREIHSLVRAEAAFLIEQRAQI